MTRLSARRASLAVCVRMKAEVWRALIGAPQRQACCDERSECRALQIRPDDDEPAARTENTAAFFEHASRIGHVLERLVEPRHIE